MEAFGCGQAGYALQGIELNKNNTIAHIAKGISDIEAEEKPNEPLELSAYTFLADNSNLFKEISQKLTAEDGPFANATSEKPIDPIDRMQNLLDDVTAILTDEQAEQIPQAFTEGKIGVQYPIGARVRYNDILWKCIQEHTSQENGIPSDTPSLGARVHSEEGEILDWVQPLGAEDAYMTGDQVKHLEKTWKSEVDNNVGEPGVYGGVEIN